MKKKLSSRQAKALELLLGGLSIRKAAEGSGVSERQLYRWLADPVFSQALKDHQARLVAAVGARLLALCDNALGVFEDVMNQPGAHGQSVASITADRVLNQARAWRDFSDLEERLTALEVKAGLK